MCFLGPNREGNSGRPDIILRYFGFYDSPLCPPMLLFAILVDKISSPLWNYSQLHFNDCDDYYMPNSENIVIYYLMT